MTGLSLTHPQRNQGLGRGCVFSGENLNIDSDCRWYFCPPDVQVKLETFSVICACVCMCVFVCDAALSIDQMDPSSCPVAMGVPQTGIKCGMCCCTLGLVGHLFIPK